jgi:hypothetical protein
MRDECLRQTQVLSPVQEQSLEVTCTGALDTTRLTRLPFIIYYTAHTSLHQRGQGALGSHGAKGRVHQAELRLNVLED